MHGDRESDEHLMRQVAQGDRGQLEPLVRRYANSLLMFIERMIGDRHQSEEIFQEVFLRVWKKRRLYRYPRTFKPWLYTIAVNCCRANNRARTLSMQIVETVDPVSDNPWPADVAVANETRVHVLAAVMRLPEQQKTVAVLRVWNDLPYAQIAQIVNRTESTVRSTMHHALANMRKYLEPRLK